MSQISPLLRNMGTPNASKVPIMVNWLLVMVTRGTTGINSLLSKPYIWLRSEIKEGNQTHLLTKTQFPRKAVELRAKIVQNCLK